MEVSPGDISILREQTAEKKATLLMQMLRDKTARDEAELSAEAEARAELAVRMLAELQAQANDMEFEDEAVVKKEPEDASEPTVMPQQKPAGKTKVTVESFGKGLLKFSGLKGEFFVKREPYDDNYLVNTNGDSAPPPSKRARHDNSNNANTIVVNSPKQAPRTKLKAVYTGGRKIVDFNERPDWYGDVQTKKTLAKGDLEMIAKTRELIKRCLETRTGEEAEKLFSTLRTRIHEMEFFAFLTPNGTDGEDPGMAPNLIKKSRILEEDGMLEIFGGLNCEKFPYDVRADSEALWTRWMVGDFSPHLLRGIDTTKGILEKSGKPRTTHTLKQDYNHKRSANTFGENRLVNGQWWPSRRCAMRDGAHGEVEAGISGQADIGAYAICIAHGGYQDKDNGETIEYCGTAGKDGIPSRGTKYLEVTFRKGESLRVLRATNKTSKFAPKIGVRYDGLYKITDFEILDPINVMKRFTLKRIPGQDPIRYKGIEARPTQQEMVEMQKIRKFLS